MAKRRPKKLERLAAYAVAALALPLAALAIGTYGQRLDWRLDLLAHLRPHLGMALLVAALVQALLRPRWLAAISAAAGALALVPVATLYLPQGAPAVGEPLSVVQANVSRDDLDVDAFAAWVEAGEADVLMLQEVNAIVLNKLATRLPTYRLLAARPRDDTRGVAAYARRDVDARAKVLETDGDRPMPQVTLQAGDRLVSLLGFSATRPLPEAAFHWQANSYDAAAVWATATRATGAAPVVVGDFNCTPQGGRARDLSRKGDLRFANEGHGLRGTWPAAWPAPLRLGIDTALVPPAFHVEAFEVGPALGGDHRPIRLSLLVPPADD